MDKLLTEGPVGHMWHPFDLDKVKTGKDLLSVFEKEIVEYINEFTPSIKIDGVNGPIRLITNEKGEKEFAIDRLSAAPLDVKGVTADKLRQRFEKAVLQAFDTDEEITLPLHKLVSMGLKLDDLRVGKTLTITHRKKSKKVVVKEITSGHGFVKDGSKTLNILNTVLSRDPSGMESIMKELGMWDDPSICLNSDIVIESTRDNSVNAIKYDEDFIAFHGLNKIYSEEGKSARKTKEIKLSDSQKQALTELVNLINQNNPVSGFRALSPFDTVATRGEVEINYNDALNQVIEIKLDSETGISKPLSQWLSDSKIRKPSYSRKATFVDGKSRAIFSKNNYVALIPDEGEQQYSVRDLLSTDAHPEITDDLYYLFASSAIFYHATRLLGREVLKTLVNKSKVGNEILTNHEGVVMRSSKVFGIDKPIKITGDFIRSGMSGQVSQKINEQIEDNVNPEIGDEKSEKSSELVAGTKSVAIMPGSFKPPHMGHLGMAEELSKNADEVFIIVSKPGPKSKRLLPFSGVEISYEKAIQLWRLLLKDGVGNIKIVESNNPSPSPASALLELMKPAEERKYYKDFEFKPEEYDKFYLGTSEKDKGDPRFDMYSENDKVEVIVTPAIKHTSAYRKILSQMKSDPNMSDHLRQLTMDSEEAALEFAKKRIGKTKLASLSANPTLEEIIPLLPKKTQSSVAKILKTNLDGLDPQNYSATDLRLLLDLKAKHGLPVEMLIKDFVGNNVEEYFRIVYGTDVINEGIISLIQQLIEEELKEISTMAGGNVAGYAGTSDPNRDEDEDEKEEVKEGKFEYSELPRQASMSTVTVRVIPSSRHKTHGSVSDATFKKRVKNRFKIDGRYTNKRAPYYSEGDIITDIVEKVLRNIQRID